VLARCVVVCRNAYNTSLTRLETLVEREEVPKQSGKATFAKLLQNWARAEVAGAGLVERWCGEQLCGVESREPGGASTLTRRVC
jgi:hypothetical protein